MCKLLLCQTIVREVHKVVKQKSKVYDPVCSGFRIEERRGIYGK